MKQAQQVRQAWKSLPGLLSGRCPLCLAYLACLFSGVAGLLDVQVVFPIDRRHGNRRVAPVSRGYPWVSKVVEIPLVPLLPRWMCLWLPCLGRQLPGLAPSFLQGMCRDFLRNPDGLFFSVQTSLSHNSGNT